MFSEVVVESSWLPISASDFIGSSCESSNRRLRRLAFSTNLCSSFVIIVVAVPVVSFVFLSLGRDVSWYLSILCCSCREEVVISVLVVEVAFAFAVGCNESFGFRMCVVEKDCIGSIRSFLRCSWMELVGQDDGSDDVVEDDVTTR